MPMPKPADLHRWGLVEQVAGFAVWDLDVPAQQVLYSPQWKGWLGYPAEDSADPVETWRSRVHPDDLGAMVQALSTHIDGQEPSYEHEFRLRAADGAYRRVLSRGQVVARDGHGAALRAVGTLTDLGKRRQAQEARQPAHGPVDGDGVSDAQRQFWLRVSHEFRTPLNAVLGFSQLLATRLGADDLPTQRLYLAHVEKAGWQLLKLVEEAMAEGGHPASTPAGLADRALPGTDESPGG